MELYVDLIEQFFAWMNERHAIYLRRKRGDAWPWTVDTILREYKFTNVYRQLDTGTQWLTHNIIEPYADDPELFFNIAVYRRHNWIGTAEELGYIHDYDLLHDHYTYMMEARKARGEKVFTGAHMLCASIKDENGVLYASKVKQIFELSFVRLWNQRKDLEPQPGDTLEEAYNRLCTKIPGYGPFIAYEVITDLRHTKYLNQAGDIMTWANPGPGARRGIGRLMRLNMKDHKGWPNRAEQIAAMRCLLDISSDYLASWMDPLEMRDIEHSLCEFDKWCRVLNGEGRPRSKFIPPHLRQV